MANIFTSSRGVLIPTKTPSFLKHDICTQLGGGLIGATPELPQLVYTLEQTLNRKFGVYMLIDMTDRYYELMKKYGEACVVCLNYNQSKPAIWSDRNIKCRMKHGTILLCEEGYLYAKSSQHGGVYLILWPPIDEPEEHIGLERDPREPQERNRDADSLAKCEKPSPEVPAEYYQIPIALWEKLDKGVRGQRKRPLDLVAHPEPEDEDDGGSDIDELQTGTSQDRRMQSTRVGHQNKKRKTW